MADKHLPLTLTLTLQSLDKDPEPFENVSCVTLITLGGQIQVYPGHTPLITALTEGLLHIALQGQDPEDQLVYALKGGVACVQNNTVIITTPSATLMSHEDDPTPQLRTVYDWHETALFS